MKLPIPCMQCFDRFGKSAGQLMRVEMRDDGLYLATCERGHTTTTVLQEEKYEVLFELAAMALLDGYPREATVGMASALERFYEFYVRVLSSKHAVDDVAFASVWKLLDSSSERQLGAYLLGALVDRPEAPPRTIDNDRPDLPGIAKNKIRTWKEFRNAVVHKGYIPAESEALAYGDLVYGHICQISRELHETVREHVDRAMFKRLAKGHEEIRGSVVSTFSIPTLLSVTRGSGPAATLTEALKQLEQYRDGVHRR